MKTINDYFIFLKKNGRSMHERNPPGGLNEWVLEENDALTAIDMLAEIDVPIYGGDVLIDVSDKLIYAYQHLGSKYSSLIWSCDKKQAETKNDYCQRSYEKSKVAIKKAVEILNDLGYVPYFVLIIPIDYFEYGNDKNDHV